MTNNVKMLRDWVNSQTAGFCQDQEGRVQFSLWIHWIIHHHHPLLILSGFFCRPKEFQHPPRRVLTRLIFTLLFCVLSLLLLLLLLFLQEPTLHTVRYWGHHYALQHFSPYSNQNYAYNTMASSTLCPCSNTAFSWTSYVQFFTVSLSPDLQTAVRTSVITDGSDFCTHKVVNFPLNSSLISKLGCPNLLNSIVSKADDRTILASTSLMDPVLLNNTVRRSIQSNLDRALNDCVFLMSGVTSWNVSDPFTWLRDLYEVFSTMLKQLGSDPRSSDLEFWNVANKTVASSHLPLIQVMDNKTAISMQISWNDYAQGCNPVYCDVVKDISLAARFFTGLAQIGGFGALMLLVVRKILWPSVRWIGGWGV